jgi:DNA-3-methyladenine glycosylase
VSSRWKLYAAITDEAAHFTRPSARSFIERNDAGTAYVYFNYGMHWMLNVLVKGDEKGFFYFRALNRRPNPTNEKAARAQGREESLPGPGKLTQALGITGRHHEINLCTDPQHCFSRNANAAVDVVADLRIGITRSEHYPWRFTLRDSEFVSRAAKL